MRLAKHSCAARAAVALIALALSVVSADGAFLRNIPQRLVQPDGTVVNALATGDEYYHRLHDAAGFTIVQDSRTGWFVYATKAAGALYATAVRPGVDDPAAAGLEPNLKPDRTACPPVDVSRRDYQSSMARARSAVAAANAVTGTRGHVVIFIRFADQSEFGSTIAPWESVFNAVAPAASVRAYYEEASYGLMSFQSTFLPTPLTGTVVSYQDSHPRSYYSPYNAVTNPDGYRTTADPSTGENYREAALLESAVLSVAAQVPSGAVVDSDGDGRVDAVTFIVQGDSDGWSDLLWPHMTYLNKPAAKIAGKTVAGYSFVPCPAGESSPAYFTFCHELGHVVGFPDLYHYNFDEIDPVGIWDMMEYNQTHFSAYSKYRYPQWIASIPEITASGTYSLNPLTSPAGNAWKIASPNTPDEYFVLEYRRKTGTFEGYIPSSGLLVYRINPSVRGNASGPPDEVYVYRPGGTPTVNGDLSAAALSAEAGRVSLDDNTNPPDFLSDGTQGRLRIFNVGTAGSTITFSVEILTACYSVGRVVDPAGAGTVTVSGVQNCPGGYTGGTTVGLTAASGTGATFLGWTISGGTAASLTNSTTSLTIGAGPAANPSATAVFASGGETALTLNIAHEDTTSAAKTMKYFYVLVPGGYDSLVVTLKGAANLYVSPGSRPTTSRYKCYEYTWAGSSPDPCAVQRPQAGIWWIGVQESVGGATVTITASAFTAIPAGERAALISLWSSTGGSSWWRATNWRDSSGTAFSPEGSECSWYGISCGGSPTRVTAIRLRSNNLAGSIPDLSALTALQVLDLGYAYQVSAGPVPSWVTSLVALKELWLPSTNRNGALPDLSSMPNLEVIELGGNSFSAGPCPSWLSARTALRRIGLAYARCTGSFPDLSASTSLEVIDFTNDAFAPAPVPAWLTALTTLKEVWLAYTGLTGPLPDFSRSTGLQVLDLSSNWFDAGPVPAWITGANSLTTLDLSSTNRNGAIPDVSTLGKLRVLALSYNAGLTGGPIPSFLANLPELYDLELDRTNRSGAIPPFLGTLSKLQYLYLYGNELSGAIPAELRALSSMWALDLSSNQLTGAIPPLDNVRGYLFLASNPFEPGPIPAWLPNSLYALDLANTNRTGQIPNSIVSMTRLSSLYLDGNQLSGDVPASIQSLTSLRAIDLRWNALTTTDAAVRAFVNGRVIDADFEATQTIAPSSVTTQTAGSASVALSWTPIRYQANGGGYRIYKSTAAGGPYTLAAPPISKSASSAVVGGLTLSTRYYFVIDAFTPPHANNSSTVVSSYSAEVSAVTADNVGVPGDLNADGSVNAGDVFYLINDLFVAGTAAAKADVNGDGFINVQDVFHLINYIFAGGPAPH